jgi:hypothetical protein
MPLAEVAAEQAGQERDQPGGEQVAQGERAPEQEQAADMTTPADP